MAELHIGKSLAENNVLWRYLSLDKLINLLESGTLYFSPLDSYKSTDPFEGYLPAVGMEALASLSESTQNLLIEQVNNVEKLIPETQGHPQLNHIRETSSSHKSLMKELYRNITRCLMVNCWYGGEHESEAMWGLYSKDGIAIKTTIGAIKLALNSDNSSHTIHMGKVKYLNFNEENLTPKDCVTEDGHLMGMIKRISYSHENEIRMFITRPMNIYNFKTIQPASTTISIHPDVLIRELIISPFASTSLKQSILAVCKRYGIESSKISTSKLLDNCEYLLDAYN